MSRLPPRPALDWPDPSTPRSAETDDVYFSGDGLAEKRAVFLEGCGLPDGWQGRERFAIGELGFGTGLAFLAAWDLWRRNRPSPTARLNFLSFERALMSAADAARIHAAWPELAEPSRQLVARWPDRARGVQRIALDDGVTLTLCIDEIASALPQAEARIDAWFLDGFAPSKNPAMWTAETLVHVARLSAPGARAATYTVAGDVRRGLEAAGFSVEKKPGVGRKRERLEARFPGEAASPASPRSVLIVGAGVAGASCASAFLKRGCEVTVVDAGDAPGAGASGNALALVMPRLDAADGPVARALLEAWLLARRAWLDLGPDAAIPLDVTHLPRGDAERSRFTRLLADPPLDETLLAPFDPGEPSAGVVHRGAIAVRPATALPALLRGARLRFGVEVAAVSQAGPQPTATLTNGETLAADMIVICAGMGAANIEDLGCPPLEGRLGQIEQASSPDAAPRAIADGGYAVEAFGDLVFGATFEPADGEPVVTDAARATNLDTLRRLRPKLADAVGPITSRAAIRATTRDRLPFAGAPSPLEGARCDGVRLIGGLGSRGFLWAPLLAEMIASAACCEPAPVERYVAELLDPDRFRRRALRRGP
ncbi:MAG: tRNA (5-methylaminomethyl-2-thiouridine)(34)-methyltransferase MnmD [Alphaproteobacteria bacterium]